MFKCMYVCVCLTYTCVGVCMFIFSSTHREQRGGGGESECRVSPMWLVGPSGWEGVAFTYYEKKNFFLMSKILAVKFSICIIFNELICWILLCCK